MAPVLCQQIFVVLAAHDFLKFSYTMLQRNSNSTICVTVLFEPLDLYQQALGKGLH